MSPSEAARGGRRWRYYVSQAILQGRKHDAGSIARVSAPEIEGKVLEVARGALDAKCADADYIRAHIERVIIGKAGLSIRLSDQAPHGAQAIAIAWTPEPTRRRREIVQGEGVQAGLRPGKRNFAGRDRARKVAHKATLRREMPIADAVARR